MMDLVSQSHVVMLAEKLQNYGATLFADIYYCSAIVTDYLLKIKFTWMAQ